MEIFEIIEINGDMVKLIKSPADPNKIEYTIYYEGISFDSSNGPLKKHDLIQIDPNLMLCMRQRFIRVGDFN